MVMVTKTAKDRMDKFVPVQLTAQKQDLAHLTAGDLKAVTLLKQTCEIMDQLNMHQNWSGSLSLLNSGLDADTKALFTLYKGPWDKTQDGEAFVEGAPEKPPATANFYPPDLTAKEFQDWVATLDPQAAKDATSFYTVIKRDANGQLYSVPYSVEYAQWLKPAAALMHQAAELVSDASLAKFLKSRADAFLSNEYLASELDWLAVSSDAPLDVTVGPYETYADALLAQKASFEMYLMIRDFASSNQLKVFSSLSQEFEQSLPVDKVYQNAHLDKPMPICAVNEICNGGDASIPMDAAYNLPNDEEAIEKGGSKLILIRNVQQAKFDETLLPISKVILVKDQQQLVQFDSFWSHTLLHEISHSNGPNASNMKAVANGAVAQTVRSALGEHYAALEEAKADIVGLYGLTTFMSKKGVYPDNAKVDYATYLAGAFRSIRFGTEEAHGKGQLVQLNFILEKGGFSVTPEGLFAVEWSNVGDAVAACCREILEIQATGDLPRAEAFMAKYAVVEGSVKEALSRLEHLPTDSKLP